MNAPKRHDAASLSCWCRPLAVQWPGGVTLYHRDRVQRGFGLAGPWAIVWQNPALVVEVLE